MNESGYYVQRIDMTHIDMTHIDMTYIMGRVITFNGKPSEQHT